ncbi:MAG: hypothetical protein ACLGHP_05225, partial [Vicinamibacteria bacterium]
HAQLATAAEILGYDEGLHRMLATPRREIHVSVPLRRDTGEGRHGPRFRVIAERDAATRTIGVWAIGPKDARRFGGQRFSALELAELRVIADDPARAEHASQVWQRRNPRPAASR